MPSSLAYTRKFIILKKELSTMSGINPKGHCKLEIKGLRGIVTANIENAEVDNFYNVVFISNDKSNSIWELGKIFTDNIGKGKGEYTFIQRELEAKNFSMDKISGILIMRDGNILLGGYLEKEDGAIEKYIKSMPLKSQVEYIPEPVQDFVEEATQEILEETIIEGAYEPVYAESIYNPIYDQPATEPILEDNSVEDDEELALEEFITEEPKQEETIVEGVNEQVYVESIDEQIYNQPAKEAIVENQTIENYEEDFEEESMEPDFKTLDYIRKLNQKNQTTSYVLSILRFFPYIDPFRYNLKGYNWWLVELDKENEYRSFLPYFSYIIGGNNKESYNNNTTTCNQLMNKYQHYLFGLYNEGEAVKYFVYGIPGSFTKDEHPYGGTNGFNTWYQGQNIEGYWIIYIDPMTGKPVHPSTPMVPMD